MLALRSRGKEASEKQYANSSKEFHKLRRMDLLELLLDQIRENDAQRSSLEEAADLAVRLKDKLDEKDAQIARLKGKLDEKDVQIEHLKDRLNAKDAHIAQLECAGDGFNRNGADAVNLGCSDAVFDAEDEVAELAQGAALAGAASAGGSSVLFEPPHPAPAAIDPVNPAAMNQGRAV